MRWADDLDPKTLGDRPMRSLGQVLVLFDAAAAIHRRIPRVVSSLYPRRPERGAHERRWLQGRWSPESTGSDVA